MRMIRENEYSIDCVINGMRVNPRYAYTSTDLWFSHLKSLNHEKINKLFLILEKHDKRGTIYRFLYEYLYEALLDNIGKWGDKA